MPDSNFKFSLTLVYLDSIGIIKKLSTTFAAGCHLLQKATCTTLVCPQIF
jgi:hypothetical protein